MTPPRIVIVHYWLVAMRGGERVLERLLRLYPGADIITHVYDPTAVSDFIASHRIRTTFIQDLPGARRHYQKYLPLMPRALEQMDLSEYDLVISSESGPSKGVIVRPDAFHLCYCHSPMRYLWDHYHQYRASAGPLARAAMSATFPALRQWDVTSAQGVDHIVANSHFIARRIRKSWGRSADVVHPPVDVAMFQKSQTIGDHYLWVGQMTPYKRADLVADAFTRLGLPLLMVGTGELARDIAKRAGPNIRIVERLDYAGLRQAYADCRALIFPAEEDFGIIPVEANAAGRPVIAFGRGGVRDSIVDQVTGLFFDRQETDALIDAVERFERWLPDFESDAAVANAERFAPENFDAGIVRIVSRALYRDPPQSEPVARLFEAAQ
ncbi:glycosyltransferase [Sphingopyxis sp. JAI128]|uniref:glycosyltransferase n=1 Tax=Sphingopyxis sp. JAI128 TaxID=2723066 RepID=UPI00161517D1|nr:glycosyltransferase [Sphingopyxis sp. JAI128]MBB6427185.1 glycosyltransferase involved in cell wall biosynthesis [Sphingopyxis sp. JAI128]